MSVLTRLRESLRRYRKRGEEQRGRIIFHAKRGRRAPRLRKSYERTKGMIAARTRSIRRHTLTPQRTAIREAERFLGSWETHGNNRAPWLDPLQREFGFLGAPYCGIGVGHCLKVAGVEGLTSRVAAVAFIEDDARAGRYGFRALVGDMAGEPGDAVCLFGRGVHVELVVSRHSWGYSTIGFNTSPEGSSGSQSNGGGVYARRRPFSQVHCVARPRYPN